MRAPIEKDGTWWLQGDKGEWHVWDAALGSWVPWDSANRPPSMADNIMPESDAESVTATSPLSESHVSSRESPTRKISQSHNVAKESPTVVIRGRSRTAPLWALITALVGLPVAFIIGMAVASAESEELRNRVAALTADSEELQGQLAETEESLAEVEAENNSLQEDFEEAEAALQAAKAKRPIPNFVGDDEDSVISLAEDLGWDLTVREEPTEDRPPGTVLSQNPAPGTVMRPGSTFTITIATEPPPGWKDIAVFTGQGENTTRTFSLPDGKVRVVYSFSGYDNAALTLYRRPRRYQDLLLNEIGNRSGETRLYFTGSGYYFEVCCGSWTIRLQEFR